MLSRGVLIDQIPAPRGERSLSAAIICGCVVFTVLDFLFWWLGGGVTPDLIPNSEVKLARGDGSARIRVRE